MADRYWVGGSGTWNTTSTTNWSASSGGASGASAPTAADNVFFDQAATYTVTISGSPTCRDLTVSTGPVTFSGSSALYVYGGMSLAVGTVWSHTGTTNFFATTTGNVISLNSVNIPSTIDFNGVDGEWILTSALVCGGTVYHTNGTLDFNNQNSTIGFLYSFNSNIRTLKLGSGTMTLSYASNTLSLNTTNLTLDAGTSTILMTSTGANLTCTGGNINLYNLSFTNTSGGNTVEREILGSSGGSLTLNNLTVTPATNAGSMTRVLFGIDVTINGVFSASGATPQRRVSLFSSVRGTQRTLTVNAFPYAPRDIDFADIVLAGAVAGTTVTRGGDCGNNSGIVFPAPKTVYWNLAGGTTWLGNIGWATSSGGTPDINNIALAHDTAVFNNAGSMGTSFSIGNANAGVIDASNRTNAATLIFGTGNLHFGDITLGTGITTTSVGSPNFAKYGTQYITTNGVTISGSFNMDSAPTTLVLQDNLNLTGAINVYSGTFDANNKNVTTASFYAGSSVGAGLIMGSGTWTLSGTGTVWSMTSSTNFTFNKGTANIALSNTTTSNRTFAGAGREYNKLTIGGATGTSILTITGSNTFSELASAKTVAHTIRFTGGTTQTFGAFTVTGTSGNVVTIGSTNTTQVTLKKAGSWYVGANSTNGGNNSGLIFSAGGGINYLSISYINGVNTLAGNGLLFGSNF